MAAPTKPVDIIGGLNLVTPPMKRRGGGLQSVQNFRNDQDGGITRIGGYERFDGQQGPSEAVYWNIPFDCGSVAPEVGQDIIGGVSGTTAVVLSLVVTSGDWSTCDAAGVIYAVSVNGTFLNNESIEAASKGGFSNGFSTGFELGVAANECGHDFTVVGSGTGADSGIYIWNYEANVQQSDPSTQPPDITYDCQYSPNGTWFAAGHQGGAGNIAIYNVSDWSVVSDPSTVPTNSVFGIAFSRDSAWLAAVQNGVVTVWDTSDWSLVFQGNILAIQPGGIAFNHDKSILACVGQPSGAQEIELVNTTTWVASNPSSTVLGNARDVDYNLDGSRMAVGHTSTPYITIYETSGYTKVTGPSLIPDDDVFGLEYSHDGTMLAVAIRGTGVTGDTLYIYDTTTWARTIPVTQPNTVAYSVAWSPSDDRLLVTTNGTQKLYLYDTGDWSEVTIATQPVAVVVYESDFEP